MKAEYDFSNGKRGALIPAKGKKRITIYIDDAVLNEFRSRAERIGTGSGYQTMMNEALRAFLEKTTKAKHRKPAGDEMRAEYNFSKAVRGKYYKRVVASVIIRVRHQGGV